MQYFEDEIRHFWEKQKMRMLMFISLLLSILPNRIHAQEKIASNQHFWHTLITSASSNNIWTIWTDVKHWKEWDTGLQDAYIEGDFQLGSKGTIISLEGRKSTFTVVAYEVGKSYTIKTKLPLGALYVKRELAVLDSGTQFTHEVWFTGITKGIFAKTFGTKFREMLQGVLANIKAIAEESSPSRL